MNVSRALEVARHYIKYPHQRVGVFATSIIYKSTNGQFMSGNPKKGRQEWTFEQFVNEFGGGDIPPQAFQVLRFSSVFEPTRRMEFLQKEQWKLLLDKKESSHSGRAQTLPYLLNRLEQEKIQYTLTAWPGKGYHLSIIDAVEEVGNGKVSV